MRKTETFVITDDGRDKNKRFALTEMPALQAEEWAISVFLALAKAGVEVPDDISSMGMAGIMTIGLKGLTGITMQDAKPLLAEMMTCVQIRPDPNHPEVVRPLVETDIEEVQTLTKLRMAVLRLHVNFSQLGSHTKSTQATSSAGASEGTRTFPRR